MLVGSKLQQFGRVLDAQRSAEGPRHNWADLANLPKGTKAIHTLDQAIPVKEPMEPCGVALIHQVMMQCDTAFLWLGVQESEPLSANDF